MQGPKCILGSLQSSLLLTVGLTKDLRLDSRLRRLSADNSKIFAVEMFGNAAAADSDDFVYSYTEEMFEKLIQSMVRVAAVSLLISTRDHYALRPNLHDDNRAQFGLFFDSK